jgi:DNA-binding NtrC family response regulator
MRVIRGYLGGAARILAVDDSPAIRATWRALLAGENYQTELAMQRMPAILRIRPERRTPRAGTPDLLSLLQRGAALFRGSNRQQGTASAASRSMTSRHRKTSGRRAKSPRARGREVTFYFCPFPLS